MSPKLLEERKMRDQEQILCLFLNLFFFNTKVSVLAVRVWKYTDRHMGMSWFLKPSFKKKSKKKKAV